MKPASWILAAAMTTIGVARAEPKVDERVSVVAVGNRDDGSLRGPAMATGRSPSSEHPEGTVFVYGVRNDSENDIAHGRPFVFEWDISHGYVVRSVLGARGELYGPGGVDFEGQRVVTLDDRSAYNELSLFDAELRFVRRRRVGADVVAAVLGGGGVALVHQSARPGKAPALTLELVDTQLKRLTRRSLGEVATPSLDGGAHVAHAGDSFYALVSDEGAQATHVVRVDDRTLRERGRVLVTHDAESETSLQAVADRIAVRVDSELLTFDLALGSSHRVAVRFAGPWAWSAKQLLVSEPLGEPASAIERSCTPRWAFGQAIFACQRPGSFSMVKPGPTLVARLAGQAPDP